MNSSRVNQLRVRHFRLIEALAVVGSLNKAAKDLHLSQPAASAMLKEVEDALGVTLFDRSRKGAVPNVLGGAAIARIRTILGELIMLSHDLNAAEPAPVLRVGTLAHAYYGGLQRVLSEFLEKTDCRIDFRVGAGGNLLDLLQSDQVDCLIARVPPASLDSLTKRGFVFQPMYQLEMCVLGRASHPLARKRKLGFQDLAAFPWALPREGTNSRNMLIAAFTAAGLPLPRIRIELPSYLHALQLLPAGDWLTVAPREAGDSQQSLGLARVLPVELPSITTPVGFIASRSALTDPNVRALQEIVLRSMAPPSTR